MSSVIKHQSAAFGPGVMARASLVPQTQDVHSKSGIFKCCWCSSLWVLQAAVGAASSGCRAPRECRDLLLMSWDVTQAGPPLSLCNVRADWGELLLSPVLIYNQCFTHSYHALPGEWVL